MALPLIEKMYNELQELKTKVDSKVDKNITSYSGDLNDIKTTGFTYADGTVPNSPLSGYSFYITTIALNNNYVSQKALRVSNELANMKEYVRECYNGNWSSWKQIY